MGILFLLFFFAKDCGKFSSRKKEKSGHESVIYNIYYLDRYRRLLTYNTSLPITPPLGQGLPTPRHLKDLHPPPCIVEEEYFRKVMYVCMYVCMCMYMYVCITEL